MLVAEIFLKTKMIHLKFVIFAIGNVTMLWKNSRTKAAEQMENYHLKKLASFGIDFTSH